MLKIRWKPSWGYITRRCMQHCPECPYWEFHSHIIIFYYPYVNSSLSEKETPRWTDLCWITRQLVQYEYSRIQYWSSRYSNTQTTLLESASYESCRSTLTSSIKVYFQPGQVKGVPRHTPLVITIPELFFNVQFFIFLSSVEDMVRSGFSTNSDPAF